MIKFLLPLFLAVNVYAGNLLVSGPFSGLNDTDPTITLGSGETPDTLNTEVSKDLQALKKRAGYTLTNTLSITTAPIYGYTEFKDVNGNNVRLVAYDTYIDKSANGVAFTHLLSTYTKAAKYQFCESGGQVFVFNDAHDTPFSYNGTTITYYTSMPKGSLCAATPTRFLVAGTTDYPNRLYFSAQGDYDEFTVGIEPEDASFDDIGLPGDKITALFATNSEWLIAKPNSIISYQGNNQYDLVGYVVSDSVGISDPSAILEYEGVVYFLSTDRKIWAYSSGKIQNISTKIKNFMADVPRDSTLFSIFTDKADFDTGTYFNSTGSITSGSVEPYQYITEDTLNADFNAGSISGSSITVSNNEITMVNSLGIGYGENLGVENGTNIPAGVWDYYQATNIYGYVSTFSVISTTGYYGNYALKLETAQSPYTISKYNYIEVSCDGGGASAELGDMNQSTMTLDTSSCYGKPTRIYVCASCNAGTTLYANSTLGGSPPGDKYIAGSSITFIATSKARKVTNEAWDLVIDFYNAPFSINITSATFISRVATAAANSTNYGYLTSTKTVGGGSVDFFIAHSSAVNGNFNTWAATTDYLLLTSTDTYWKYKANLYRGNTGDIPSVQGVSLIFKTTGYWESPEISLNDGITSWGSFVVDDSTTGAADWTYQIKSATYTGGTASATYYDIATSSNIGITVGSKVKVKATNTFASSTETVRLNSITLSYNMISSYLANAFQYLGDIFFSLPFEESNTNTRLAKLDMNSGGWQIFNIPMNTPYVKDDTVYFGSPTGGYLYKYPFGNTDNGSAINSYWKSKVYLGDNPYVEKEFNRMSVIAGSDYGSSLDLTYTLDTTTSTTYSIGLTTTTAGFIRNNRNLTIGDVGTFYQLQVGNNATTPWTFFGASVDYTDSPWRVLPEE